MKIAGVLLFAFMLTVSESVYALCIGCGCQKAYKSCLNGVGACTYEGVTDTECCRDLRNDCHQCDGGLVCIRLSAARVPLESIPPKEMHRVAPFMPIIKKVERGEQLTEAEYEIVG